MTIYLSSTLEITDESMIDGADHAITFSGDYLNDDTADIHIFMIESSVMVTLNERTVVRGTTTLAGEGWSTVHRILYRTIISNCGIWGELGCG